MTRGIAWVATATVAVGCAQFLSMGWTAQSRPASIEIAFVANAEAASVTLVDVAASSWRRAAASWCADGSVPLTVAAMSVISSDREVSRGMAGGLPFHVRALEACKKLQAVQKQLSTTDRERP